MMLHASILRRASSKYERAKSQDTTVSAELPRGSRPRADCGCRTPWLIDSSEQPLQSGGHCAGYEVHNTYPPPLLTYVAGMLLLVLVGCQTEHHTSSSASVLGSIHVQLDHVRSIVPELTKQSGLVQPRRLRIDSRGHLIWAESSVPIPVFDSTGTFVTAFGNSGAGPGELATVDDFDLDSQGRIHVLDQGNKRVSVFGPDYEFVRSYSVNADNLKRMSLDAEGRLYLLREAWYNGHAPAVLKHDLNGAVLDAWGKIPDLARAQTSLLGGGLEVHGDHVFYGYLTDHRIWQTDLSGGSVKILDEPPDYYKGGDRILQEGEPTTALISYWFSRSQMKGLFLVEANDLLFQLIQTRIDSGFRNTLEVWHTDGHKLATGIDTPGNLFLFHADDKHLYFVENSAETEDQNSSIKVYAYALVPSGVALAQ